MMIECKNLTLAYGAHIAVKDLSFTVKEGEYLRVVGGNGSGKTTLLKGILGLILPVSGEIRLGCEKKDVGYLPQVTEIRRDFPATVMEITLSGSSSESLFYSRREKAKAVECLERTRVVDLQNRRFGQLSEGQRRRVLLARALMSANRLLILDEPAAGLDLPSSRELYAVTEELHSQGLAAIEVTHDWLEASVADTVLELAGGRCAYFGPAGVWKGGER